MFASQPQKGQFRRDFRVSYTQSESGKLNIFVGPRFLPHRISARQGTADFPGTLNYYKSNSTSQFDNFYCPESSNPALFEYLKSQNRKNEVSQYFPGYAADDELVTGRGKFEIAKGSEIFFWIKSPYPAFSAYNPPFNGGFADLDTKWAKLEFGAQVPPNVAGKMDKNGQFSYCLYIPIFKIRANDLTFAIDYFDIGELRYFSDNYIQNNRERTFDFSEIGE